MCRSANIYAEESTTILIAATIEFAILVLSLVGIKRASQQKESHLGRLLRTQGIAYFVMVLLLQMSMIVSDSGSLELAFAELPKVTSVAQIDGMSWLCRVVVPLVIYLTSGIRRFHCLMRRGNQRGPWVRDSPIPLGVHAN